MSQFDRAIGMARSLLTYHAIPLRQRRLRALYRPLVGANDLVFDIGAHVGSRVRVFAALGCRVVAVEPQPDFARLLELMFARVPTVQVVRTAVSHRMGVATLSISERTPTVSTLDPDWRTARSHEPGFASVQWNRDIDVRTTTLDALIETYGVPGFVKIDVEGAEESVLAGLGRPVGLVSFEYLTDALERTARCVDRLEELGSYEFNWSAGETHRMASQDWLDRSEVIAALRRACGPGHGDVYARLTAAD